MDIGAGLRRAGGPQPRTASSAVISAAPIACGSRSSTRTGPRIAAACSGESTNSRVPAGDFGIDADPARHEQRLAAAALAIDQQVAIDRGAALAGDVDRERGPVGALRDPWVGQRGGNLEPALAHDDRHGDAVDRHEVDREPALGDRGIGGRDRLDLGQRGEETGARGIRRRAARAPGAR